MATSEILRGHPPRPAAPRGYRRIGHSPYGLGPRDDTRVQSLQARDQSLSSQHINHREVGPLQAVAAGPSEAVVLTRLVVGRETAESPGPCESRCSSKSASRCSSGAFNGQASAAAERSSACPPSGRMTRSKRGRAHIVRRERSMGAIIRGCHAAPVQSGKQASAGPARDASFATVAFTTPLGPGIIALVPRA